MSDTDKIRDGLMWAHGHGAEDALTALATSFEENGMTVAAVMTRDALSVVRKSSERYDADGDRLMQAMDADFEEFPRDE